MYKRNGEWTSYTIHEARTGWVYAQSSRSVDALNGLRILLPYGTGGYKRGQNLMAPHNEGMEVGEWLAQIARDGSGRILRRGQPIL